jgi:thymidine phosphorylase
MGLINKIQKKKEETDLSKEEVQFILNKLRNANYKGEEFEQFFKVMKKLTDFYNSNK